MYYTLKCDAATTQDNYPCGEWDYTTYTRLYDHKNINSPYYFYKKSRLYRSSSSVEKCFMLAFEMISGEKKFIKKYDKSQLLRVNFDKFVSETDEGVEEILTFLKSLIRI